MKIYISILVFASLNINICYSQVNNFNKIFINKSEIHKQAQTYLDSCYKFSSKDKNLEKEYLLPNFYCKDSLILEPIPIFKFNKDYTELNSVQLINFHEKIEKQVVFVKNNKDYIVSEFLILKDASYNKLYYYRKYIEIMGAYRLYFSLYNFKNDNFYFFLEGFKGLFEIKNNKIYYILAFFDKTQKPCDFSSVDIRFDKKPNCIEFVKIEFDSYLKSLSSNEMKNLLSDMNLNEYIYNKKALKKYKKIAQMKSTKVNTNIEFVFE